MESTDPYIVSIKQEEDEGKEKEKEKEREEEEQKGERKIGKREGKGNCFFLILLAREATWLLPYNFSSAFQVLCGNLLGGIFSVLET